jgi:hypothetical protein
MVITAGRRPRKEGENMRVGILTAFSVLLLLTAGAATAGAARKQPFAVSQQLCASFGGTFLTRANSSFFRPFYKKQGVLWTCNSYSGGSTSSQALVVSCSGDAGQAASTSDAGFATCWKNSAV